MVGIYEERILPWILHRSMSLAPLEAYRSRTLAEAAGRVLEVGAGSGLNLPHYPSTLSELVGVDVSAPLLARARLQTPHVPTQWLQASAEALPFPAASFDTAVMTWTLCSVARPESALAELRRVLRPGGKLLFVEHGRSPEPTVARWQERLTPLWKRLSGGCHMDRDPVDLLEGAGFHLDRLDTGYLSGPGAPAQPKLLLWMLEGAASPRRGA